MIGFLLTLVALAAADYGITKFDYTEAGVEGKLGLLSPCRHGGDYSELTLDASYFTAESLRIRIQPKDVHRFVPTGVFKKNTLPVKPDVPKISFRLDSLRPFQFSVVTSDGLELFNFNAPGGSKDTQLYMAEQYLQISTHLLWGTSLHGFGVRKEAMKLKPSTKYGLWNYDAEDFKVGENLYSSHPFILATLPPNPMFQDFYSFGILFHTSNAAEILTPPHDSSGYMTFRTIGGILDMTVITGPRAEDVVRTYHDLIGRPYLHPFWTLGVGQSSYSYNSLSDVKDMVSGYVSNNVPLDIVYTDISTMESNQDFTLKNIAFKPALLQAFVRDLHKDNRFYVHALNPAISNKNSNREFNEMMAAVSADPMKEIYVRCPASDGPIISRCWPGNVALPDFTSQAMIEMWQSWVTRFYGEKEGTEFDGLWLEMSEPGLLCNGECGGVEWTCTGDLTPEQTSLEKPPYTIGTNLRMEKNTLRMSARHSAGAHYDLHNMYGFHHSEATRPVMDTLVTNKNRGRLSRSLLLSRSTFLGSGATTGTWLGENDSNFDDLAYSIGMIQQANMHGMSLVGPETCGYTGEATPELCTRWYALAAWYPLVRNNYRVASKKQEPYTWGPETATVIGNFMRQRYTFTPYLYGLIYNAHRNGGMVWQPVHFEFTQETFYADMYVNATMIGKHILVTPVVTEGALTVTTRLPYQAKWRGGLDGNLYTSTTTVSAPLDAPAPYFIRAGAVIPRQMYGTTLIETGTMPFFLTYAVPDEPTSKIGTTFYFDDGVSVPRNEGGKGSYIHAEISGEATSATAFKICNKITKTEGAISPPAVTQIHLLGATHGREYTCNGVSGTLGAGIPGVGIIDELVLSVNSNWCMDITLH